jgi:TolB-like protein/Tfp pilus assembly protein PilF
MTTTVDDTGNAFRNAIADLRRRRIFRVAGAYAVIAWVIIEASDVVLPALGLPDAAITWVVLAALAGFPLVLVLTWVFDLTGGRIVRTVPDATDHARVVRLASVSLIVITALIAVAAVWIVKPGLRLGTAPDNSIAVLPFVDLSENQDSEYFGDGIAEEVLNRLVSIDGLRVAARTSSFAFRRGENDVRDIGAALDVATVLEGSVRRSGDRVRITAQLIEAADGYHLWSQTFDRRLDDIFAIQDEISIAIIDALKLTLIGPMPVMAGRETANIKAYDLYLLGRHHWHNRTQESLGRARNLFEEAIALDPDFALAHSGLADTYLLMDGYGELSSDEAVRRAEPHVARALALDSGLAEAYASLGLLRLNSNDPAAAELALRSATEINPNYSMAHMWLGLALEKAGDIQGAHEAFTRSALLDPLHPVVNHNVARSFRRFGEYETARSYLGRIVERDPADPRGRLAIAELDLQSGQLVDAARLATGLLESGDPREMTPSNLILASVMSRIGEFDRAARYLAEIPAESDKGFADGERMRLAIATNDRDKLLEISARGIARSGDCADYTVHDMRRLGCVLSGMSLVFADQEAAGLAELQAALPAALEFMVEATPELAAAIHLISARASAALGDAAQAERSLEASRAVGEGALAEGWRLPGLYFNLAVASVHLGDERLASDYFDRAIDGGWTDYWIYATQEDMREVFDSPSVRDQAAVLTARLAEARVRILGILDSPDSDAAIAMAD